MKCYTITKDQVSPGITIGEKPFPRIIIGDGGNKRATWIPLGKRDESRIVQVGDGISTVEDVGIIALRNDAGEPDGRYLIVAPRNSHDERVLVLWRVRSGYRGDATISAPEGAVVVGHDSAYHSGRGSLGATDEMLTVLRPGDTLIAKISGRRVQCNRARLTWTGDDFEIVFFPSDSDPDSEVDGDYI